MGWLPTFGRNRRPPSLPPEVEDAAELTRQERAKLAVAVVELNNKKNDLVELLMARMLEERRE